MEGRPYALFSWWRRSYRFRHSLLWFWFDSHFRFRTPKGGITGDHFLRDITHLRTHCINAGLTELNSFARHLVRLLFLIIAHSLADSGADSQIIFCQRLHWAEEHVGSTW